MQRASSRRGSPVTFGKSVLPATNMDDFTEALLSKDDDKGPIKPRLVAHKLPPRSDGDRIVDAIQGLQSDIRHLRQDFESAREVQRKQLHWVRLTGFAVWVMFTIFMFFGFTVYLR